VQPASPATNSVRAASGPGIVVSITCVLMVAFAAVHSLI
jgi:hypothetical protein